MQQIIIIIMRKLLHEISLKGFSTIVRTTETFIGETLSVGNKFNLRDP